MSGVSGVSGAAGAEMSAVQIEVLKKSMDAEEQKVMSALDGAVTPEQTQAKAPEPKPEDLAKRAAELTGMGINVDKLV